MTRPSLSCILLLLSLLLMNCKDETIITPGPSDRRGLVDPNIQPAAVSTYPPNYGLGPFRIYNVGDGLTDPHFFVVFNKLMDRDPIRGGGVKITGFDYPVTLTATVVGGGVYSDVFSFVAYDTLSPRSRAPYRIGRTYTVTLDTTLVDINGNRLREPYSFSFLAEPAFRVLSASPPSNSANVSTATGITITFNGPVDTSIFHYVSLQPAPAGSWYLAGRYSVSYDLSGLLALNTTYSLSVMGDARDTLGNHLTGPYGSAFTTRGFGIQSTTPGNGSFITPAASLSATFSAPLDPSTVPDNISLEPATAGSFRFSGSPAPSAFTFEPGNGLLGGRAYTLRISTGVRSANGDSLPQPYAVRFYTEFFSIWECQPGQGETTVGRYRTLLVRFNAVLDSTSTPEPIIVTPALPGRIRWSRTSVELVPTDSLLSSQVYVVTVNRNIHSAAGDSLTSAYTYSFTTAP